MQEPNLERRAGPMFTIIIPTYNRQEMLDQAVESVVDQAFADWELIIVDDHSPVPVQEFKDPRIRAIRNASNLGKPASVNRALELARGLYICLLDDDDAWAPERLQNALRAHQSGADLAVCAAGHLNADGAEAVPDQGESSVDIRMLSAKELRKKETLGSMGRLSVRYNLFLPMNETYRASQDVEWYLRALRAGPTVAEIRSPDWLWRRHSGERHMNGTRARIASSQRLLQEYSNYYASHSGQHARRIRNLGYQHLKVGDWRRALMCGMRSFRVSRNLQAIWLVLKSLATAPREIRSSGRTKARNP